MGWDDPTFNGVWFRGMGDGIAPRSEYTRRFEDDPVPRNRRDGGVLSDAPFLPSLSRLLPRVRAPLLLPRAGGELQVAWRGRQAARSSGRHDARRPPGR